MADAKSLGLTELAKLGFVDLESTLPKLDKLVASVGDAGRAAFAWLAKSANPDQALNGLLDLSEASLPQLKKLLKQPESAQRLVMTIGASSALIDVLRRAPSLLAVFEKSQRDLPTLETMTQVFTKRAIEAFGAQNQVEQGWNALRLAYREELIRVSAFDVSSENPQLQFPLVSAHLADMAGAALDAALTLARLELVRSSEHGVFTQAEVDDTALAVLAMGKCGARELNYISDVDVIFVADSAGAATTVERALEVATKLVTRMMRALDANSNEPALWQVDPNLRPEGKSGALVRTLDSHLAYYDRWAQNWEFQALLKARPVAGDKQLGFAYVESTQALVWSSAGRDGFVDSAQKMRERVMEYIPADEVPRQIKLGPGGLRDIEFTVQLLQLVHGRTDESVRVRDTLTGIQVLRDAGYIAREDAISFDQHYRFLRLLEHRIQLSGMRRTHLMPTSEAALRALARATGYRTSEELLKAWESVKAEVRSLHQKVFYRPLLSAVAKLEENELSLSSDQAEDRLRAIGFLDPTSALRHIQALTSGLSRRAAIQKSLLPVLLQWFAEGSDPDIALLSFRRLSEDLGDSPWFLKMLRDSSGAAQRLSTVLSLSRLATSLFERIPEAAAWLESLDDLEPRLVAELQAETDAILERHEDLEKVASTLRGIRRRETLRLALGAVVGNLKLSQLEAGLTELFEVYLRAFLKLMMESSATGDLNDQLELAIVAMGRFGGGELGFGSDADVMFVYRALKADGDTAQKTAERIISEIRRMAADPVLEFELDLDLRPEGKNGPIARSLDSYAAYYERWGNTWESQALLRARVIAGADGLAVDFENLVNAYRYPEQLDAKSIIEIRRIKARVETERLPQGADPKRHLKLGRGSLSDVEWLVQIVQLQHGHAHASIRTPKTLDALQACVEANLIDAHDARVLREAWILASRVRSASVLWANKRSDVLPNDRRALEGMARILEYPPHSASALEQDYLAFTRRSRMVFERLFYGN